MQGQRINLAACYRLVALYGDRAELRSTNLVWPPLLRKLDRIDPSYWN